MARLLVIDDEKAILDALARVLERDGHTVVAESRPTRALDLDLARFDLVITDVMMPDMDGFELVRRMRDRVDLSLIHI